MRITLFAGAMPFFVASPLRAKTNPAYPSGMRSAMPVGMRAVSPGAIATPSSIQAYISAPAAEDEAYFGMTAFGDSFLTRSFLVSIKHTLNILKFM